MRNTVTTMFTLALVFGCNEPMSVDSVGQVNKRQTAETDLATTTEAEMVTVPGHYYYEDGKLVCERINYKPINPSKCDMDYSRVVVYTNDMMVRAEDLEQFNKLEQDFVQEALRQYQLSKKLTPEQIYENLQKAEFKDHKCWFNGLLTCKLGEIVNQRNALVGSYRRPYRGGWVLAGGFVNTFLETPLQEERFGPYGERIKQKLTHLQKEFGLECVVQQLIKTKKNARSRKLLKTVLTASSVMVRNLPTDKRQPLFDEWYTSCGEQGESPQDSTIRFLLSSKVRRIGIGPGNGQWLCYNTAWAWGDLIRSDACGTLQLWYSEGERINIASEFRGVVPTLPEAKRAVRK